MPPIDTTIIDAMRRTDMGTERWVDVLRLLGRLEFVGRRWVHELIFPERRSSPTTCWSWTGACR